MIDRLPARLAVREALTQALACISQHYPWGSLTLGAPNPAAGPWLSLAALAEPECQAGLLARLAAACAPGTPLTVLGTYLFRYALEAPLRLAGYLFIAERRVPHLGDNVRLRDCEWLQHAGLLAPRLWVLSADPLAGAAGVDVAPDLASLTDTLLAETERSFAPLLDSLAAQRFIAPANAWGALLDGLAQGMQIAGQTGLEREAAWARWEQALAGRSFPVRRRPRRYRYAVDDQPHELAVRAGCCLWFMTPEARAAAQHYCTTCYLTADAERLAVMTAYQRRQAAARAEASHAE